MARDEHLSEELLHSVITGEMSLAQVILQLRDHVLEVCPTCRERWERYQEAQEARATTYTLDGGLNRFLEATLPELLAAQGDAAQLVAELRTLQPDERPAALEAWATRAGSPSRALIEALLEESRHTALNDPRTSHGWAKLAEHAVTLQAQDGDELEELRILAVARQANGLRLQGREQDAVEEFHRARELMAQQGIAGGAVAAEVDSLEGSLALDLGAYDEAVQKLNRAIRQYQFLRQDDHRAKVMIKLGYVYSRQGRFKQALSATYKALILLHPQEHHRLYLGARYNLAYYYSEQGEYDRAFDLLDIDEDLLRPETDQSILLNRTWLYARIYEAFGQEDKAIRRYREAREGFLARCDGYDVALVSLDLAGLYRHLERREDALQTASEALQLAQSHGLHKEALAALSFLVQSFQEEHHAAQALATVTDFLNQVRRNPEARFQAAGG